MGRPAWEAVNLRGFSGPAAGAGGRTEFKDNNWGIK